MPVPDRSYITGYGSTWITSSAAAAHDTDSAGPIRYLSTGHRRTGSTPYAMPVPGIAYKADVIDIKHTCRASLFHVHVIDVILLNGPRHDCTRLFQ
eukprot:2912326-Rhodomonas_salina.2